MRNAIVLLILVVFTGACGEIPQAQLEQFQNAAQAESFDDSELPAETLDLTGRWHRVGSMCGNNYTTVTFTEYLEFTTDEVIVEKQTFCGLVPLQYYALEYPEDNQSIKTKLTEAFAGCGQYDPSPSSPWVSKAVTLQGDTLKITEGWCNYPETRIYSVYERN